MSTPVTYRDQLIDRYKLVHDWVPSGCARILDVGCGNALFTQWLRPLAPEVFGADHNLRNCRSGKRDYPELHLAASAAEHLPYPDASFDCVICSDTIEHTMDDRASVGELLRVLQPGGTLILSVPQGGLFGWMDGENVVNGVFELVRRLHLPRPGGGYRLQNFRFQRHQHYRLPQLLEMLGGDLEVLEVYQGGLFLYPFLYLIEKCLESFCGRDLVKADYRLLRRLRAWDFRCRYGALAFNIAIRARKRDAA